VLFFFLPAPPWRRESVMRHSSPYHPLLVLVAVVALLSVPACEEDKQSQIGFSSVVLAADLYPHVRVTWESLGLFGQQQQSVEVDKKHTHEGPFETGTRERFTLSFSCSTAARSARPRVRSISICEKTGAGV